MSYVYLSPRGIKTTITQNHVNEAVSLLQQAGYSMQEALDLSLEYVIARINIDEIPEMDLMYATHDQHDSNKLCGIVAQRLAERKINYTKKKYI